MATVSNLTQPDSPSQFPPVDDPIMQIIPDSCQPPPKKRAKTSNGEIVCITDELPAIDPKVQMYLTKSNEILTVLNDIKRYEEPERKNHFLGSLLKTTRIEEKGISKLLAVFINLLKTSIIVTEFSEQESAFTWKDGSEKESIFFKVADEHFHTNVKGDPHYWKWIYEEVILEDQKFSLLFDEARDKTDRDEYSIPSQKIQEQMEKLIQEKGGCTLRLASVKRYKIVEEIPIHDDAGVQTGKEKVTNYGYLPNLIVEETKPESLIKHYQKYKLELPQYLDQLNKEAEEKKKEQNLKRKRKMEEKKLEEDKNFQPSPEEPDPIQEES